MTYVLVVVRFRIQNWLLTCDKQDPNPETPNNYSFSHRFQICKQNGENPVQKIKNFLHNYKFTKALKKS